jgi:hypothetical protein
MMRASGTAPTERVALLERQLVLCFAVQHQLHALVLRGFVPGGNTF